MTSWPGCNSGARCSPAQRTPKEFTPLTTISASANAASSSSSWYGRTAAGSSWSRPGWTPVDRIASMISRSRCVPTSRTACPLSANGIASAEPMTPDPRMTIVLMSHLLLQKSEPRDPSSCAAQHVRLEPLVAECTARVKLPDQAGEVGQALVPGGYRRGIREEHLAPVRTRGERRQRGLDWDQRPLDLDLSGPPREVKTDRVLTVLGAHPELVGCHGPDLAHLQQRPDRVRQCAQRLDRCQGVPPRDEVLRLDFLATTRREARAKMWQALRPRARDAQLWRTVDGIDTEDRMPVDGGRDSAEEIAGNLLGILADAALDPDLIRRLRPAGEYADAVAAGGDLVEVLEQRIPAETLEDTLAHLVCGLDIERDARHRAERPQPDHEAVEVGVASRCPEDLAIGLDHLQSRNRRGKVAVGIARPVCAGSHGTRDGDVRQRGQVSERQALRCQSLGQRAVLQARSEGHGASLAIDDHVGGQIVERQQLQGVADVRE